MGMAEELREAPDAVRRQQQALAAPLGEAHHHRVEALDQAHRVGFRMIGDEGRQQLHPGPFILLPFIPRRAGNKERRPLAGEIGGEAQEPFSSFVVRHEHQDRVTRLDQCYRAVQELGTAEGLGMAVGDFLQFEGGLAGDRQSRTAADRDQAVGIGQWAERRGPVEIGGADEALR